MAITIVKAEPLEVDIHRVGLKIVGSAWDINRVLQSCHAAMRYIEQNKISTDKIVAVYVKAPQDDEP